MTDLLIRNVDPDLKRRIEESARQHSRSLSDEIKALLRTACSTHTDNRKLGTLMANLLEPEYRGDDLVFERKDDPISPPPDFE